MCLQASSAVAGVSLQAENAYGYADRIVAVSVAPHEDAAGTAPLSRKPHPSPVDA